MRFLSLLCCLLIWPQAGCAQEGSDPDISVNMAASHADPLIVDTLDRLETAYGGAALRNLKTLKIESDRRLAWPGQGQTADFVEFATDRMIKHFDLDARQGSVERWIAQSGNVYHNRYVIDGQGGASIDYFNMSVTRNDEASFARTFAPDYRMSDLLMAHQLIMDAPPLTHLGSQIYQGRDHDVLGFSLNPDGLEVQLYVGKKDGLVHRLVMERDIGTVNILFSDHHNKDGLVHATEMQVYIDETLVEYEDDLAFHPNSPVEALIRVDEDLSEPRTMMDTSEMTVDTLGPALFMVGQEDYSLFVQHDNALIGVNAYPGLKARYEALVEILSDPLPLRAVIVTHHHSDHMDGIDDAIEMGARLYVTEPTRTILEQERDDLQALDVQVMTDASRVGPFEIKLVTTGHAVQNAFVFHTDTQILFQDDHYHPQYVEGASRLQPTVYDLHDWLVTESGWTVRGLLSGHARKMESWVVFDTAVKSGSRDEICPSKRIICATM